MAKKGLSGPRGIFEGKYGFLKAYSDVTEPETLTHQLGTKPFEIDNTTFKFHAGCLYAHSALNGIIDLMRENDLEIKDIDKVLIGLGKSHYRICAEPLSMKYSPVNVIDAQASLPYLAAIVMSHRRPITPKDFYEKKIKNHKLLQVAKKVEPRIDSRFDQKEWKDKRPADVVIKTLDGRTFQRIIPYPVGDPKNPLSFNQIKNKFTTFMTSIIDDTKIKQIIQIVNNLDRINDITELTNILRTDAKIEHSS